MILRIQDYTLPVDYTKLTPYERKLVRLKYITQQQNICYYCKNSLNDKPAEFVIDRPINTALFPLDFFKYPIHLHHCHTTGLIIGAVHADCNAVMWQYENK